MRLSVCSGPTMGEYEKCEKVEASANLRTAAFCAVVLSTVAITACLVSFPMIFHYVQALEAAVQGEIDFCKVTEGLL